MSLIVLLMEYHCALIFQPALNQTFLTGIKIMQIKYLCAAGWLAWMGIAGVSQAAQFSLYQDGFSGGGYISGSFTGADLNGDGRISVSALGSEVSSFDLSYSGGALIGAQTWTLQDLLDSLVAGGGLDYVLGVATLGSDGFMLDDGSLALGNADGAVYYASVMNVGAPGLLSQITMGVDQTGNALQASVPEPGTLALLGLGSFGLAWRRRQQRGA